MLLPPHLKGQELWDYLYLSQRCFLLFLGLSFLVCLKRIPEMRPFKVLKDEDPWVEGINPTRLIPELGELMPRSMNAVFSLPCSPWPWDSLTPTSANLPNCHFSPWGGVGGTWGSIAFSSKNKRFKGGRITFQSYSFHTSFCVISNKSLPLSGPQFSLFWYHKEEARQEYA